MLDSVVSGWIKDYRTLRRARLRGSGKRESVCEGRSGLLQGGVEVGEE